MKYLISGILVLFLCAAALAQICLPAPQGYVRSPRPQGTTPHYPPPAEPACYLRGTNYVANYISCTLCHYYLWRNAG